MAVLDHPVHQLTVGSQRYDACREKIRKPTYLAPDRIYDEYGNYIDTKTEITDESSLDCRYDMSLKDPKCEGCRERGLGEDYDRSIRQAGS